MLVKYHISEGRLCEGPCDTGEILLFTNPTPEEREYLIQKQKIDEHTLSSALDPDELSRLEFEPDHVAIILKNPKNYHGAEHFLFRITSMGLFMFKNRLVIVTPETNGMFEGKLFARVHSLAGLVLKLTASSIIHFLGHLKVINMLTDELETKINAAMENRYLLNLFALEKSLVYYLNAIHTNGVLINRMRVNAVKLGFDAEELGLLEDLGIDNDQCYKLAEIYSNVLASMMDARASIVNNNLNVLMKTLNIITIAIMMPTLVVSIFSMNVPLPFGVQATKFSFWGILGLSVLSMCSVLYIWKRKKI